LLDFRGVVRHQPDRLHPEDPQDAGRALVGPEVGGEAQNSVRVHRVEAVILKMVGRDFVCDPDPSALLGQVQQGAAGRFPEFLEGSIELCAAVAALGPEHIARDALGVEANEDILAPGDLSFDQGHMVFPAERALERVDAERSVPRGEPRRPREEEVVAQF